MTWIRAFAYAALAVLLAAVHLATRPPGGEGAHPLDDAVPSVVDAAREAIVGLAIDVGERRLYAVRRAAAWEVREPEGAQLPPDLIPAILTAVLEGGTVEVVAEDSDRLADFGLDPPVARLRLEAATGPPVHVALGDRNPAQTAVYARVDDRPQVLLVGLSLWYYIELAIEAAG